MSSTSKKSQAPAFLGRSAFHRINFLYQACNVVSGTKNKDVKRVLNAHYGQLLSKVAKKSVLRMDISIKRKICKGCGSFLNSSDSCKVRKDKKNKGSMRTKCLTCKTFKTIGTAHREIIWHEKLESVHNIIEENNA